MPGSLGTLDERMKRSIQRQTEEGVSRNTQERKDMYPQSNLYERYSAGKTEQDYNEDSGAG